MADQPAFPHNSGMSAAGQTTAKTYARDALKRAESFFSARLVGRRPWALQDEDSRLREIIAAMLRAGWTRAGIAAGAGVDLSQLCGWLAGRRRLGPQTARRLGRWARPALRALCRAAHPSAH